MKGMVSSPLLEIAISFVNEINRNIDNELMQKIRYYFSDFISGKVSKNFISSFLSSTIHSTQPLDKIEAILSIPNEPLPSIQDGQETKCEKRKKTRTWTQGEDMRLIAAIHRLGYENWSVIAKFVGNGRTRAQCSQRWHRVLDPRISKEQWTAQDDEKLIGLIATHNMKSWTSIAEMMGNRSDVQCRYHYMQLKREFAMSGVPFPVEKKKPRSKKKEKDTKSLFLLKDKELEFFDMDISQLVFWS